MRKASKPNEIASYTFWDLDKDKNVHVEKVKKINPEAAHKILDPHRISYYVVRWVVNGKGTLYIDHIPISIRPNLLMVGTPKQITRYVFPKNNDLEVFILAFNEDLITLMNFEKDTLGFLDNLMDDVMLFPDENEATFLREIFELMITEFRNEERIFSERILADLTKTVLHYLFRIKNREKLITGVNQGYINLYRQFIFELELHYKKEHYVADYTTRLNVTEKKLNRACRAITKETASAIIQKRIEYEAKRLLFYSTKTIKEIGYELGFRDSSYFNKFFSAIHGISPGNFRKHIQERI